MFLIKPFLVFALVGTSALYAHASSLVQRDADTADDTALTKFTCENKPKALVYTLKDAENAVAKGTSKFDAVTRKSTAKSGYPHQFHNLGATPIVWTMNEHECNKDGVVWAEAPVLQKGKTYNFDTKPKEDPGPARAIFVAGTKTLCGVVGHTDGNKGFLKKCAEA